MPRHTHGRTPLPRLAILAALLALPACELVARFPDGPDGDADADTDADTDVDSDIDADTDSDADADADADPDADPDADAGIPDADPDQVVDSDVGPVTPRCVALAPELRETLWAEPGFDSASSWILNSADTVLTDYLTDTCQPPIPGLSMAQRDPPWAVGACVVWVESLSIANVATLRITGPRPLIIAVRSTVDIDATSVLDASSLAGNVGPGGFAGGGPGVAGEPLGAGGDPGSAVGLYGGGGGGANATNGGEGGCPPEGPGGVADLPLCVSLQPTCLSPGAGGGGGIPSVDGGGEAGRGGGALMIVAGGDVTIDGVITADGASASQLGSSGLTAGGGGGGAGGMIVIETTGSIAISEGARLSAIGGQGGPAFAGGGFIAPGGTGAETDSSPGSPGTCSSGGESGVGSGGGGGAGAIYLGEATLSSSRTGELRPLPCRYETYSSP